jgi:CRISPR-associated endonuclease/helicase Cas3
VLVCELCDENGRSYAGYVYDSTLLVATKAVLKDSFDERDCPGMVAAYYRKVREITAENPLWEDISSGRWGEFHDLIEKEERGEATLVVAYEGVENDLDLLSRQAAPDEDVMRMVEQKREASRRLGLHAVSVPVKMLEEWLLRVGGMIYGAESGDILRKVSPGIYLVQGEGIGRIYSRRTGFMPPDLEAAGDGVDDW